VSQFELWPFDDLDMLGFEKSRTLATAVIANVRSNLFIETDPQFPSANRR
jgi:hypothetical protein